MWAYSMTKTEQTFTYLTFTYVFKERLDMVSRDMV